MRGSDRERALQVVAACAAAMALSGVVSGFREHRATTRARAVATARVAVGTAPTYAEERERTSANRLRHPENLLAMVAQRPSRLDPVPPTDETGRATALAARMQRRAYDGAPPTVPHPVTQLGATPCLTCHRDGMDVAGRVAPAMPHGELGSCLQCHVVSEQPMPGLAIEGGPPTQNSFVGMQPPNGGERWSAIAPPTIPHSTLMRARCDSCHGVLSSGIRSTHPWRESCTQCHAPSSQLDQRPTEPR